MPRTEPEENAFERRIFRLVESDPDPVTAAPSFDDSDDGAGWADDSASYDSSDD